MKRLLPLFAAIALALPAHAAVESMKVFERIPVLEGGRVLPMDSFARHQLLAISGKSSYKKQPATVWLARTIFTPDDAEKDVIFLIENPDVAEALGLEAEGRARYSYEQLKPCLASLSRLARKAFAMADADREPVDKEFIRLYTSLGIYSELRNSMQFAVPQPDLSITDAQLRKDLGLQASEKGETTFLDLTLHADAFAAALEKNRETKQEDLNNYQKQLFAAASGFNAWAREEHGDKPALIPLSSHAGNLWISAWEILGFSGRDETINKEIGLLGEMVTAYRIGKQVEFDMAARAFYASVTKRAPDQKAIGKLPLEVTFNKSQAFYRAEIFYGLAFLASLLSIGFARRWIYLGALAFVIIGLLPHTYGIIARMFIMGRPPVTNLYATFIFVAWVCCAFGLVLEWFQRNRLGTLVSATSGLALLMTAARFDDGDTMGVMVAVLDSNFWLATHVVTISIGYAGCCVAGLLGAIYLIQATRRIPTDPVLRETLAATYGALGFGLIFSFLGTMLGGVWADQSWGRFWGWDPKENGALVIVLWSAIVFHARLARIVGPRGFAVGSVLGIIGVLMAWLGVNLLNVGLHSYGFTSGLMLGFNLTWMIIVLFLVIVAPLAKKAPQSAPPAAAP